MSSLQPPGVSAVDLQGKKPRHPLQARITATVVGLVIAIWIAVAVSLFLHYREAEESAERNVQNLVRVIESQVRGELDAIDLSLLAASNTLLLLEGRARVHDAQVHALLKVLLAKSAPVRAMWVTNELGDLIHDTDKLASTFNFSHRDYFIQQRDQPEMGLYVGQPISNPQGVWFVSLSRRIAKADGSFGGVVVAALEPKYFEKLFASLDVGRDGSLVMLTSEFNVVARVPKIDALRGQNVRGKTPLPALIASAPEGVYRSNSAADGLARIHAYRQVSGYPMVVVAGLGRAEVLASWWRVSTAVLAATVFLSGLLAILGWRVLRELTTSRQLHSELQHAKRLTDDALLERESLLQAIPDLMFEIDLRGRIHGYKGQRDDLLYVPPSAFMGKNFQDVLPAEASAVISQALQEASVTGLHFGALYWLNLAERPAWFELSVARKGAAVGLDTRFVIVTRDVTERVEAARKLEALNLQLRRSNSDLELFAYAASHDLLEPLRSVAGSVQLLKRRYEGQLDERADTFIGHAVGGVNRMQTLIEDLLAFSRISTVTSEPQPVDLGEVLESTLANLQVALAESNAQVTYDKLPTVMGDAGQLGHLMLNLVANALKFRGNEDAVVHVSASRDGVHWVCAVKDKGIGIPPQHFERIFGIFKRLHTREEYAGNGIGLTLCQRIIERHSGRIWVESAEGQGTTFFFTLPDAKPTGDSHA